jgi:hypothetical protein
MLDFTLTREAPLYLAEYISVPYRNIRAAIRPLIESRELVGVRNYNSSSNLLEELIIRLLIGEQDEYSRVQLGARRPHMETRNISHVVNYA